MMSRTEPETSCAAMLRTLSTHEAKIAIVVLSSFGVGCTTRLGSSHIENRTTPIPITSEVPSYINVPEPHREIRLPNVTTPDCSTSRVFCDRTYEVSSRDIVEISEVFHRPWQYYDTEKPLWMRAVLYYSSGFREMYLFDSRVDWTFERMYRRELGEFISRDGSIQEWNSKTPDLWGELLHCHGKKVVVLGVLGSMWPADRWYKTKIEPVCVIRVGD